MIISISTLKRNRRVSRCQQNFKDSSVIPEIKENPFAYFYLLSKTEIHIFKQLCWLKQRFNIFKVSQCTLAKWCRVSREYVNKVLRKFEDVGILKMWYHHKAVSHYRLSSFFSNTLIASLSVLWRAIPLIFLMSQPTITSPIIASEDDLQKSSQYIKCINLFKISSKFSSISSSLYSDLRSKEKDLGYLGMKLFSKKGREMQAEELKQLDFDYLKSIRLTLAGKVKISAYPVDIIKQADERLFKSKKPIANRWSYLNQTCSTLCAELGTEPNWGTMYKLSTKLNIPVVAPFYDETFVPEKPVTQLRMKRYNSQKGDEGSSHKQVADPDGCNLEIIRQCNSRLYKEIMAERAKRKLNPQPKRSAHDIEWERIRVEEPQRFERLQKSAQGFRQTLGINEQGEFVNGATPEVALQTLSQAFVFKNN